MRTNKYFSLNAQQAPFVKQKLRESLRWHRTQELPAVSSFLLDVERRGHDHYSQADVIWMQTVALGMRDRTLQRIVPDAAAFLVTVKPAQIKTFRAQFEKDTEELLAEMKLPQDKQVDLRASRLIDFAEFWTGSLDEPQKKKARDLATRLPNPMQMRLAYRAEGMSGLERLVD